MIRYKPEPAMVVRRSSSWRHRMVYIVLTDRSIKYPSGRRSHVVYIGTTRKGAGRPASNAASKAMDAFREIYGVKSIHVRLLTCRPRSKVRTWEELESSLLVFFRWIYGGLPHFNKQLEKYRHPDEVKYFRHSKLRALLESFEKMEASKAR